MDSFNSGSILDVENIDAVILKQQFFYNSLLKNNNKFLANFSDLNFCYISDINSEYFVSLKNEIYNKLLIIQRNNDNNLTVLMKNREKYNEASEFVSRMFSDI